MQFNNALRQTIQYQVAYRSAAASGTVTNKAFRQSMASTVSTMQTYNINAVQGTGATNTFKASLKGAASWLRQMSIGLYVVGGAATSIARPLIALSMILNTYQQMEWESATLERWIESVGSHFKWLRGRVVATMKSINMAVRNGIAAMLRYAKTLPVIGGAVRSLMATIRSINLPVFFSWVAIVIGALAGLGIMATKISKRFEDVSEHIQRAISVSSIAQDQFDSLTHSIFNLQRRLGVFNTTEIANMVERMAYAGVVGENFKETAMAIGQIAYVTGMEMAEITRDMARLTSQTGLEYKELANVILRTFAQASITYEETVESFQQAGMLLREDLGMTTDDLGAIVVQLEKFGYTGTRAATAIRSLAARSSELKSGLRGANEVFKELGVTEMVEEFQKGNITLDKLILGFGEAGASYGHMVNIFNRRAGVAAAAIAEFPEEYAKAAEQIKDSTTTITEMFDDLRNTQQGLRDALKASRSRAMQRWAYQLREVAKTWMRFRISMWDLVGALTNILHLTNALVQAGIALGGVWMASFYWPLTKAYTIIKGVEWVIQKIVGLITGEEFNLGLSDIPVIGWIDKILEGFGTGIIGLFRGSLDSITNIWQNKGLSQMKAEEMQRKQLEQATDEYSKEIAKATEELNEFSSALSPDFLKKLIGDIEEFRGNVMTSGTRITNLINDLNSETDKLIRKEMFGEGVDWGRQLQQVNVVTTDIIRSFIKLNDASTYLKGKFEDVSEGLEEMFGLTRTINRRHAAVTRTGERIGRVRGMPGGAGGVRSELLESLPDEAVENVRMLIDNFGRAADTFLPTVLKELQDFDLDSGRESVEEAVNKTMIETILGVDLGPLEKEIEKGKQKRTELFSRAYDIMDYGFDKEGWAKEFRKLDNKQRKQFRESLMKGYPDKTLEEAVQALQENWSERETTDTSGGGMPEFLKWTPPNQGMLSFLANLFSYSGVQAQAQTTDGSISAKTIFQGIANQLENIDDNVSTIATSVDEITSTKIVNEGDTATVTIEQKVAPNFQITVEGATGDVEGKIRRAISRAKSELENSVRSAVDPDALEKAVIEKMDEEVEGENGNGGKSANEKFAEKWSGDE